MTEIKIELSDAQIQDAFSTALMAQLNECTKAQLVAQGIRYLLTPAGYGNASPITRAFNQAIDAFASRLVKEYVEANPELQAKVREVMQQTAAEFLSNEDQFRYLIRNAVAAAISRVTG